MIRLENITFSHPDGTMVFENLSLTLEDGSRTALMGRSGIGKTTLLEVLAGLKKPLTGQISGVPARGISMVFQENRLLPHLTVAQNILLMSPKLSPAAVRQLLEELALPDAAGLLPAQLSGGMARRAAIARALAFDSPLVVMDEPFKGLDSDTLEQVLHTVDARLAGRTFVLVTHSPAEAEVLGCTKVPLEALLTQPPPNC